MLLARTNYPPNSALLSLTAYTTPITQETRAQSNDKIAYLERWRNVCVRLRCLKHSLKRHHRFIEIYTLMVLYKGPYIALGTPSKYLGGESFFRLFQLHLRVYFTASRTSKARCCVVSKNGFALQDNIAAVDVDSTCKIRARVGLRLEKPYPCPLGNNPFSGNTLQHFCFRFDIFFKENKKTKTQTVKKRKDNLPVVVAPDSAKAEGSSIVDERGEG